jgi:DNA-binding MarR family transcriptional regulator
MNTNTNPNKNALRFIKELLVVSVYLHREGGRLVQEHSLTQQQFVVLNEIVECGAINQKDIVGNLLFEKSNVSKIVKKLSELGYIEISTSKHDRRVTIINSTERGEVVWRLCIEKLNSWSVSWLKAIEEDDLVNATKIFEKLRGTT